MTKQELETLQHQQKQLHSPEERAPKTATAA